MDHVDIYLLLYQTLEDRVLQESHEILVSLEFWESY